MVKAITEEALWYADSDRRILGAVLFDKTNMEWAFVVLGRDGGNGFSAVQTETCLGSKEEAEAQLIDAMRRIEGSGKEMPSFNRAGRA